MRRPPFILIFLTGLLLVLAACGGSPSESPDASSGGGEPSTAPAESEAPVESQTGGGGGGGGGGGIGVTLSNGGWTGGQADVEISGDATASISAPLFGAVSITDGGSTTLNYVSAEGGAGVGIAIYTDSFAVSVTTAEVVGGGGTTTTCTVNWHSTDDNNISGDFNCPNSPAFTTTGGSAGTIDIEGSFTATR